MKKLVLLIFFIWPVLALAQFSDQRQFAYFSTGSGNAQIITIPNYNLDTGVAIRFVASFANTGFTTLNVNGTGVKNVLKSTPSGLIALTGGEISVGSIIEVIYDGVEFQLISPATVGGAQGTSPANPGYSALVANSGQVSTSNPLPVMTAGTQTFVFSLTSNGAVPFGSSTLMDTQLNGDYTEAELSVISVGTGGVLTITGTNDQVNFYALSSQRNDGVWASNAPIGYAGNYFTIPIKFRYFAITVSGLTAGTASGSVTFKTKPNPVPAGALLSNPNFVSLYAAGSGATPGAVTAPDSSIPITTASATTIQVIAGVAGKSVYVTDLDVMAAGTTNVTFSHGTQTTTPCDTASGALTGAFPLTAGAKISHAGAFGAFWTLPTGQQLCMTSSAAIQVSGWVSYAQR